MAIESKDQPPAIVQVFRSSKYRRPRKAIQSCFPPQNYILLASIHSIEWLKVPLLGVRSNLQFWAARYDETIRAKSEFFCCDTGFRL